VKASPVTLVEAAKGMPRGGCEGHGVGDAAAPCAWEKASHGHIKPKAAAERARIGGNDALIFIE
jgi:hypothetical protein